MKAFKLFLGLSLLCIALYVWYRDDTRPPVQPYDEVPQPSAATVKPQLPPPSPLPPTGMVYVPGGTFQMGRNTGGGGDAYEAPGHAVTISPFFFDMYEVTNADYASFVNKTKRPPPTTWISGAYPSGADKKPVTGVTWNDADAYARWAGKRLPTEAEWEFAAKGAKGFRYPWGDEWEKGSISEGQTGELSNVGAHPSNKSPFGALDMVGNVWEWTGSDFRAYPGGKLPTNSLGSELKVLRGCMYKCSRNQMTTTYRRGWPATGSEYQNTGFRCAKSVTQ